MPVPETDCCGDCQNPLVQNIPGPQGTPGAEGQNGTNGTNAFTVLTAAFIQPGSGSNVTIAVASSAWVSPGQPIFIQNGGFYTVVSIPDGFDIVVQNLGYTQNATPASTVPTAGLVVASGFQGPSGSIPGGALLAANNLSDLASISTARSNLSLGALAVLSAINNGNWTGTPLAIGNGGTGQTTSAAALTALGAQPLDALLTSLATFGSTLNEMYYLSATNTLSNVVSTAFGRSALTDATAVAFRSRVGLLLPQYGLLGSASAVNMNSGTTDTPMTIEATRYTIEKMFVENASLSLTTATAGIFTGTGGGGTSLAADQSLASLTAASKYIALTAQTIVTTDTQTAGTLYFRVGTPQGSAATANCWVYGWKYA